MTGRAAGDRIWLHEVGVVSALGRAPSSLRLALSAQRPDVLSDHSPFWPVPLPQGLIAEALPSLERFSLVHRTRCNAILLACYQQIEAAVIEAMDRHGPHRVAIVLGTSTSGIGEAQQAFAHRDGQGHLPDDFCLGQQALGGVAEFLGRVSGIRGPCYTISTACTSAAKALASAGRLLRAKLADVVVAGGVDALNRFTLAGFSALECMSPAPCNPMSANRDGITIGEGAALFIMSREPSGVALAGSGESSDAHHFSAPDPQGRGALLAMQAALASAGLDPDDIDYINLHGTATVQNDAMESRAVDALFGTRAPCSSTKPLTGHTLGAAGAVEAAICWHLLADPSGALPPHWWDGELDAQMPPLHLVEPGECLSAPPQRVLSNSFAFGGSNVALVLERADAR